MRSLKVLAIICAHNEADIIGCVVGRLIEHGIDVYLMDNNSNDGTPAQARPWLGRGLVHIERFPQDAGYPERNLRHFVLTDMLKRKEEISRAFPQYDWFIHGDADEIREGPWPQRSLRECLAEVDHKGFNAVNFQIFNFVPVNDSFQPGADVGWEMRHFEPRDWCWVSPRIDTWKQTRHPVHLADTGGHSLRFPEMRVFPLRFLLRHYPLRGQAHGRRKIFQERVARYAPEETARGWHGQYRGYIAGTRTIIADAASNAVAAFDLAEEQKRAILHYERDCAVLAELLGDDGTFREPDLRALQPGYDALVNAIDEQGTNLDRLRRDHASLLGDPKFDSLLRAGLARASLAHDYGTARRLMRLQGALPWVRST